MSLRKLHLVIGAAGLLAFLLTGQYMHWQLDHLRGMADGPRLFWRTSHIYLMWSAALNLALGCNLVPLQKRSHAIAQRLASVAVLAGPALLLASFFSEHFVVSLERPMARYANILAFAGVLTHGLLHFMARAHRAVPATAQTPAG